MISSFATVMANETEEEDFVVTYQSEEIIDMGTSEVEKLPNVLEEYRSEMLSEHCSIMEQDAD